MIFNTCYLQDVTAFFLTPLQINRVGVISTQLDLHLVRRKFPFKGHNHQPTLLFKFKLEFNPFQQTMLKIKHSVE